MALTPEWQTRIDRWDRALWQKVYHPLGSISLEGFTTLDQLNPAQAEEGPFAPMPPGTRWGRWWEYGWFRGTISLPPGAEGRRIVLRLSLGGDALIWVNGEIAGSCDWAHSEIQLTHNGEPGTRYTILAEAYAGHGTVKESSGPLPYGWQPDAQNTTEQAIIGESTFGIWDEEAYQLCVDFSTLSSLRKRLDTGSLRQSQIDEGLMEATLLADPELPPGKWAPSLRAGRERLRGLLECVNGSTTPTMFAFGHAHLDVAWLWPLAETRRKMARTLANQLSLIEEYPEYRYLQSQAHLLWMLKEDYPDLYQEVKRVVQTGNVIPEGGMWVEADTNLSSGESLIRQFLFGERFFYQEFGVESQVCWLPDVFGYSGALPQILRGCGIEAFSTQKINWNYAGGEPFPYNTFIWEGIDGSAVLAHIYSDYNTYTLPENVIDRWAKRNQANAIDAMLLPFGWGDGGGGPSRNHLEYNRRLQNLEGTPRVQMASPAEFFAWVRHKGLPKERYVGELYFQAHRGTYTSQARTKAGNRRAEFALREAEFWGAIARARRDYPFSPATLQESWRSLLLHQFHDILPGSSIQRVHAETHAAHDQVIAAARETAQTAAAAFLEPHSAAGNLTVFNSLGWRRKLLVELPDEIPLEKLDPLQTLNGKALAEVEAPPCGWTTLDLASLGTLKTGEPTSAATAGEHWLENEYLRVIFNPRGEITSLWDKESSRELAAGLCNRLLLYKDVPGNWDAWDIDSMVTLAPVELDGAARLELLASGPLVAQIKRSLQVNLSNLEQTISLRRGSRRVEFQTTVDWRETHKLLKVSFPVAVHANEAIHEIQFGHLRRPNHASRRFDADRFEVCNHKWTALAEGKRGVAVLNDGKYGVSVAANSINLTLLKAATAPDPEADKGRHSFTYALYAWNGSLAESSILQEAYDLNCPALVLAGAGGEASLFQIDAANLVIETVKPAEDGSPATVIRMYEAMQTATRCTLRTPLAVERAWQTDLLENPQSELDFQDGQVTLDFRPFEIKTLLIRHAAGS